MVCRGKGEGNFEVSNEGGGVERYYCHILSLT